MKYLIIGLGNIGREYENTRHNIGFITLDALAEASNVFFTDKRYGAVTEMKLKNKELILLKPSTYMNASGKAVCYWMQQTNVSLENLLIVVDDLTLPFGRMRLKPKGGDAGHNGLKHIQKTLGTKQYSRLRFGIGNNFSLGRQIDYVLSPFTNEEQQQLSERMTTATGIIRSFCLAGVKNTMNLFNNK